VIAIAQPAEDPFRPAEQPSESIVGQFEGFGDALVEEPLTISARLIPANADRPAVIAISAEIAGGKHIYSLTQPRGGPLPTEIELNPSAHYRLLGPFRADPEPSKRIEQGVWKGLEIQEHEGEVAWYAPIELTAGVDASALEIQGTIRAEVCETGGTCQPVEKQFTARIAKGAEIPPAIAAGLGLSRLAAPTSARSEFQLASSAVKFSGRLVPAVAGRGDSARIELTATLPKNGRIYALADRDRREGTKPVLIAIETASGLVPQRASTDAPLKVDRSVPHFGPLEYYEGAVTWSVRLDVPGNAPPGPYPIRGLLGYQACEYGEEGSCELPQAVRFEATLQVGNESSASAAPVAFAAADGYGSASAAAEAFAGFLDGQSNAATASAADRAQDDRPALRSADQYDLELIRIAQSDRTLSYYIALAFVGGLILNLMPCVLPVIGLKVMSFVEQAHKSRSHALVLNLWFAAGIVSVFLLLGVLAGAIGLSWGGQFGSTAFNATIASIVFAMALSLLGVWEVPIPGFFGRGSIHAAAAQEGPVGAFLKGVITTVLATPCTAPFMAPAIAWAVTQNVPTTLVVFASLGAGMASPYLVVGLYPELLRFLPKPGGWMVTFKQISGFVLLATVVFILSFIAQPAVVPTVAVLLGVGVACWLVGRAPLTAEFGVRLRAWAYGGAVVLAFVALSFGWLYRVAGTGNETAWQPFSLERLKQLAVEEGKTVLVDFSAEWCLNCKVLEQAVLHTEPVETAIARTGVVTMYADYTNYPPEIDRMIKSLGANGVPVIAIFPGSAPYHPIVFSGGYTQQGLISALEKAAGRRPPADSRSVAEASTVAAPMN
jgi:thiol:disulfide interchange protein